METELAEDGELVPDDSFLNVPSTPALTTQSRSAGRSWGCSNAIDRGNYQLEIQRYNGGLFQLNATIDALEAAWRLILRAMLLLVLL